MIDKEQFKNYILAGKTIPQLQEIYGCSRSVIAEYKRQFGFVGLTPNSKKVDRIAGIKTCNKCLIEYPLTNFYSNGYYPNGVAKYKPNCSKCETSERTIKFYNYIIDYLSVNNRKYCCEKCSYTNIFGSLDFHHTDPNTKDFDISSVSRTCSFEVFVEKVIPELDKCVILCPNCHRLEHLLMGPKWNSTT